LYLKDQSEVLVPVISSEFGDVTGGNYSKFEADGTLVFYGDATVWEDLRISATTTTTGGSNPAPFGQLIDDGNAVPIAGASIAFAGASSAQIPASPTLDFTGVSWSVGFWFKPEVGHENDMFILDKHKSIWQINLHNSKIRVKINGQRFSADVEVNVGATNNVVVTVDGASSSVSIYLDSVLIGFESFGGATTDANAAIYIGSEGNSRKYADMTIDEIRFWDKELSPAEISAFYNAGLGTEGAVAAPSLIAGYHLNEGAGVTSADYSGGGLDIAFDPNPPLWGAGLVTSTAASRGVFTYFFSPGVIQEVFFTAQIPHAYLQGSDIHPHVHWVSPTSNAGTVIWGLEYTWANLGTILGTTTVIFATEAGPCTALEHTLTSLPAMPGTGKGISSMLSCRLFRDGVTDTYPDPVALLEFDFHYQIDTFGSRQEFSK